MAEETLVNMNSEGNKTSAETGSKPKALPTAFWIPETKNYVLGSAADLDQMLKTAGIKLRRELLMTCQSGIDAWTALLNPPSVHTASHTLVEMAMNLSAEDRDLFTPLGDHGVCMPLRLMEKYLYPTIKLMHFLHERRTNIPGNLPGGMEAMALYSFYLQGQVYPRERTQADLDALHAATLTADHDLVAQIRSELGYSDTVGFQMRTTLYNLRQAFQLPPYDELLMKGEKFLHEKQEEIDRLVGLYDIQHSADHEVSKYNSARLTMYAHLAHQQAAENLALNLRLVDAYEQADIRLDENVSKAILSSQSAIHEKIGNLLQENYSQISRVMHETRERINPYEVEDMRRVLQTQKSALHNLQNTNAVLVAENSKLRMHLSLMPVQYHDFAAKMQATNHQAYLAQRTDPKVIVPRDNHANGGEITLMHAPMSHPSVQAYLRDAQYTSVGEAKAMLERSFQLRSRLRDNKDTARIPFHQSDLTQYQSHERPYETYADMFDTASPQHQGGETGSSVNTSSCNPSSQRLVQQPLAKGKRPLESVGRGQPLKNQRMDHEDGPRIKGKARGLPQCFPRFREAYIPISWRASAHSQYDLQKERTLPQKGIPIP